MSNELTKDADRLLALMYKAYLEAKASGKSRSDAKNIGDSGSIRETLIPAMSQDDVDELCRELDRADYLYCFYADDTISFARLEDAAIICLENRFKNGLLSVADFLSKFIP